MGATARKKRASELPFCDEKLVFRQAVGDVCGQRVLCAYAGREAILTADYVARGASVLAVDKETARNPVNCEWVYGKIPDALPDDGDFYLVDFDPDGSPWPVLEQWLSRFRGSFRWLVVTDGAMTMARYQRKMDMAAHYGLVNSTNGRLPGWVWRNYEAVAFHRLCQLVPNRELLDVRFQRNPWQMGLYAAFLFGGAK